METPICASGPRTRTTLFVGPLVVGSEDVLLLEPDIPAPLAALTFGSTVGAIVKRDKSDSDVNRAELCLSESESADDGAGSSVGISSASWLLSAFHHRADLFFSIHTKTKVQ
jgi:hypothetical protein